MTAAFLPFLTALAGALLVTCAYDARATLAARLAASVPVATAALGLVGYALGATLGLRPWTLSAASILLLLVGALVAGRTGWTRLRADVRAARASAAALGRGPRRPLVIGGLYVLLLAALLASVFDRAIVDAPAGLATGVDHNLGDLPFHLSVVAGFTRGANFPPEHPELAGVRLTYPFAIDLAAALHVAAGATVRQAFLVQDLLLAFSLAYLLWRLTLRLTGDGRAALLAPPIAFLSGGLGFAWFVRDLRAWTGSLSGLLLHLPRDYTMLADADIRWGNALTTLLVPQRAFLLGLPLALLVVTLWWDAVGEGDDLAARRAMTGAGVLTGLLPLAHAHGFVVLMSVGALVALVHPRRRRWIAYFAVALLVALPQVAWMARGSSTNATRFLAWHFGWDRGDANPIVAWALNAGVFLVLYLAGLAFAPRGGGPRLRAFLGPFALWFVVPNLLRLSPWIWDNVKFLFYWYVASVPVVALVLARLSRRGAAGAALAALAFVATTASGALDVLRVATRSREHVLFDRDALAIADRIVEVTPPRALILHHPTYNSPVLLTGRRSLLGYPGHIWSQGLDASGRSEAVQAIYQEPARAPELLARLEVDFLLVGPQERAAYGASIPIVGLERVATLGAYEVFRVPSGPGRVRQITRLLPLH